MVDRGSGDYFFFFDPTSKKAISELGVAPPANNSRSHQPVNRAASTLDVSKKYPPNPKSNPQNAYPAASTVLRRNT